MAYDGIVTKQVVCELKKALIGGKINKVFEPNKNEIILGIYSGGKNYALNISISSNNYRMHLTTNSKPNPLNAPNFCMLLRKHLVGCKITDIYSNSLERIVYINLEGFNELNDRVCKKLVIELMGKHSNIILLNERNIIIDSMRHLDSSSNSCRDILPTREYSNPPSNKADLYSTSFNDFSDIMKNCSKKISDILPDTYSGISKVFIRNIIHELNISDDSYSDNDIKKIYDYINKVINNLSSSMVKVTKLNQDYILHLEANNENLQANFFLDDFYKQKEDDEVIVNYRNNLSKLVLSALKKVTKKVNNINSRLKECDNMDIYRMYGELITANLYRINNNINVSSITLENYYDNNSLIDIPLDNTISPRP